MTTLRRTLARLNSGVAQLGHRRAGALIDGMPLALLHTRGRYHGREDRVPLLYVEDGDGIAFAATHAGSNLHPAWYLSLVADPEVTVEVDGATKRMRASVASEPERTRLYESFKRRSARYARYEAKSARTIPVVRLREADAAA